MRPHHQRVLDKLIQRCQADAACRALILTGSIALGRETDASDVDFVMVVTDEEFNRRLAAAAVHMLDLEIADWPGGYAEGKAVSLQFLRDAGDHGSEPARFAFAGAKVVWSRIDGLQEIVDAIAVYPRALKAQKMAAFYAHMKVWQSYVEYGHAKDNAYLASFAGSKVALLGGRIILAHNEILFPYHKWFVAALERAPKKPDGFMDLFQAVAKNPCADTAERLRQSLDAFLDLERGSATWISRFVIDAEWNWFEGKPPVEDW